VIYETGGAAGLTIATDNDDYGAIWFADPESDYSGAINYYHATNLLGFGTAWNGGQAGLAMVIDSTGNVGIGTTSPNYPLVVNGSTGEISIYASDNISASGYITRTSVFDKSKGKALDLIKDADYYKDKDGKIEHKKFYGYVSYPAAARAEAVIEEYESFQTDYSRAVIEEICELITVPAPAPQSSETMPTLPVDNETLGLGDNETLSQEAEIGKGAGAVPPVLNEPPATITVRRCRNITTYPYNITVTMSRTIYPNITQEEGVSLNKEIDLLRQAVYELKLELKPSKERKPINIQPINATVPTPMLQNTTMTNQTAILELQTQIQELQQKLTQQEARIANLEAQIQKVNGSVIIKLG